MTISTIGTTVLEKTGTTITKRLVPGFKEGRKVLETTVQYGKNTPMVKRYGIDSVIKTKFDDSILFTFNRGRSPIFYVQSNSDGTWRSIGGKHYASELCGETTKEAIKNHLAMFKATLGLK